tara:strand:- start:2514 stop:2909 length:396 start_codon:yes stop_codon:yes gene_type:complete
MPLTKDIVYSDFNTTFGIHPVSGDLNRLTNDVAVKRSIKNIILTQFYERPFNPDFGSDVRRSLFENFTSFTKETITEAITEAIGNYELRAELLEVYVKDDPDYNRLNATIVFRMKNNTKPTTLQVFLERIR